jgi:hypothetical protein
MQKNELDYNQFPQFYDGFSKQLSSWTEQAKTLMNTFIQVSENKSPLTSE